MIIVVTVYPVIEKVAGMLLAGFLLGIPLVNYIIAGGQRADQTRREFNLRWYMATRSHG